MAAKHAPLGRMGKEIPHVQTYPYNSFLYITMINAHPPTNAPIPTDLPTYLPIGIRGAMSMTAANAVLGRIQNLRTHVRPFSISTLLLVLYPANSPFLKRYAISKRLTCLSPN